MLEEIEAEIKLKHITANIDIPTTTETGSKWFEVIDIQNCYYLSSEEGTNGKRFY